MHPILKCALWGFIFGAVGLYVLAALALITPLFEYLSVPLMYPGRKLAEVIAGAEGSTFDVLLLTLFNGALYAAIFAGVRAIRSAS